MAVVVMAIRFTTGSSAGEVQILEKAPELVFRRVEGQVRLTVVVHVGMDPYERFVLGLLLLLLVLLVLLFVFGCGSAQTRQLQMYGLRRCGRCRQQ